MSHTCAALSSAAGKAGIAVIRMTGDDAAEIAAKVFRPASGKPFTEIAANTAVYGSIHGVNGEKIDTGIAVIFRAPRSYTGEDLVEISAHGSPVGVSLILAALFAAGAKPAEPGEFTKRAFVNGKLDLTQAEAVAELLDAENAEQLKLFSAQLDGGLGKEIGAASAELEALLAEVYAYIDYPDEDMTELSDEQFEAAVLAVKNRLTDLTDTYASGSAITRGVDTVLVGAPNTGKSTLFNALAGYDRAIVTDIAGTTRDVVSETVTFGGVKLVISDTAGIRETEDTVEKIGVERSEKALAASALVFAVFDGSVLPNGNDIAFMERIASRVASAHVLAVINKCDLASEETLAAWENALQAHGLAKTFRISAKSGAGKAALEEAVRALYPVSGEALASGRILTNARQHAAVCSAVQHLDDALNAIRTLTRDMAGLDLEQALGALSEADGRQVSEQVVSTIFARFCVGK